MTIAYNESPNDTMTALNEGSIWKLIHVTLVGDTFKTPFNKSNVIFGGDLAGLAISGSVSPGVNGLGQNQVILDGVNGTITRTTGKGTITIKGAALNGGNDITLRVDVVSVP